MALLTRDEVRRIAREEGLAEFAESLVDTVSPGWRLDVFDEAVDALGGSKVGGDPDLAPDESWPINHRGIPMTFLAQINCDELPELPEEWTTSVLRPAHGVLLRAFADLVDNPFEPGPARALVTSTAAQLVRTAAPSIPSPWPAGGQWDELEGGDRVRALPQTLVRPMGFLTAPEEHPILRPEQWTSEPMADRYYAWANRVRRDGRDYSAQSYAHGPWTVHHFLGEASSVQGDARHDATVLFKDATIAAYLGYEPDAQLAHADAWQTLLSLHNDDRIGLEILDSGVSTVLVPTADLRAGTFHRTVCVIDSA